MIKCAPFGVFDSGTFTEKESNYSITFIRKYVYDAYNMKINIRLFKNNDIEYIKFGHYGGITQNKKDLKGDIINYDNSRIIITDVIFNGLVINKPIVWRHKIYGKMTFQNCQISCSTPIIFDIINTYSFHSIPNNIEIDYLDCSWDITTTENEPINKPMFVNGNGEADFTNINPVHIYYGSLNVSDEAYNSVKDIENIQILPSGSTVTFEESSSSNCEAYLKKIYGDNVEVYNANMRDSFYIELIEKNDNIAKIGLYNSAAGASYQYSSDNEGWYDAWEEASTTEYSYWENPGDRIYFKGVLPPETYIAKTTDIDADSFST